MYGEKIRAIIRKRWPNSNTRIKITTMSQERTGEVQTVTMNGIIHNVNQNNPGQEWNGQSTGGVGACFFINN